MRQMLTLSVSLCSLVLCACTSAPIRFYTLLRPVGPADRATPGPCCLVQIKRVSIPAAVDRPELVTRGGEHQLVILSNDAWLAPLRDEIRSALLSEIDAKLSQAAAFSGASTTQRYVVLVDVTRFESTPGREVFVTAGWRVSPRGAPLSALVCESSARHPTDMTVSASVAGYQLAIRDIADEITLGILQALHGTSPGCVNK